MRYRLRHLRLLPLLAVIISALTLTACGGGNDSTSAQTATSAATTEAPAASTEEPTSTTEGSSSTAATPEPATLKVALDWVPNPDHVGLYYALDKGYYDDQGLTVTLKTPSDASAALKLLASNKFDLAISYETEMPYAAVEGLPVISVAALIPRPLSSLMALPDGPVQSAADLKGHKLGSPGPFPSTEAFIDTMLKSGGLTRSDVQVVNVGYNLLPALLSKKVDAITAVYQNVEGIQLEIEVGSKPVIIPYDQVGVPTYDELVIVANKDRLASDPAYADAVRRFLAAAVKGAEGAQGDPAEATAIMKKSTDYEADFLDKSIPATIALLAPPNGAPMGCQDLDAWQTFIQWTVDNNLIKKTVNATDIATNDYLPGC